MELEKNIDVSLVVNNLLEENKRLRLELATLKAYEKQQESTKKQDAQSDILELINEEDRDKISPKALEALQKMKFE